MEALLTSIPASVWGVLVGAVLGWGGALIANLGSSLRQRQQQEHDSREKEKDRKANLRRDVCINAVVEVAKAFRHLVTVATLDPIKEDLSKGIDDLGTALSKVQLVAEPGTALLAAGLSMSYTLAFIRLAPLLKPVFDAKSDIEIADKLHEKSRAEVERITGEMTREFEAGNKTKYEALNISAGIQQSLAANHARQRDEAWSRRNRALRAYHERVLTEFGDLSDQQVRTIAAVRSDLGLGTNQDAYLQMLGDQQGELIASMKRLFDAYPVDPDPPGNHSGDSPAA